MHQIQKKMSIRFARSLSFPLPTSKSRPLHPNPLFAQINIHIQSLRSWPHNPNPNPNPNPSSFSLSWIPDGLSRIDRLHASFSDLLNHPLSQPPLRSRRSAWADRLLEDSLRFADVHGSFRSAIIALNHQMAASRSAVRRRDDDALVSASREQRKTEKELLRLAADARSIGRSGAAALAAANVDLAGVAHEVTVVTAAASAAVFAGIAMLASAAVAGLSPKCVVGAMLWRSTAFKKRVEEEGESWRDKAMEKMEAVEKSISELEEWSHRVFRRMLNIRVFLLNAQTPILENVRFLRGTRQPQVERHGVSVPRLTPNCVCREVRSPAWRAVYKLPTNRADLHPQECANLVNRISRFGLSCSGEKIASRACLFNKPN